MNFTAFFIRRAVATTLLMVGILVFGILSYTTLPVSDLPEVEYPTITVTAALPGANPDTMASSVATPLEKQFSTIAGVELMTSSSSLGTSSITLQFDLDRNIDAAAQDVQAAISRAGGDLPPNMPAPPSFQKVNPAEQPITYMSVSSPTHDAGKVGRIRRTADRAPHFHGFGRGERGRLRIKEICGSRPDGPERTGYPADRARGNPQRCCERQSESSDGIAIRPDQSPTRSGPAAS